MSETSNGRLAFVKETVAGVPPATPAFKVIDFTDEDLAMSATSVRSAAVTSQGVVAGSRRTGKETGGGLRFELYRGPEVDELLQALMGNPWDGNLAKAGGPEKNLFTFERKISDTMYRRFHGTRIGSAEFTVAPEAAISVRLAMLGATMTTAVAPITGATYAAPSGNGKLTSLDVQQITMSNGLTASLDYENLTFTVNNQLGARKRLGPNSVRGVGKGQTLVTGTARVYVDDNAIADSFNDPESTFDMDVPFLLSGKGYTSHFKNVSITSYSDPNTGNNNEFIGTMEFEATLDSAFASSFGLEKIGA